MKLKRERRENNTNQTERITYGRKFTSWHEMNRAQRQEMTRKIQAEDLSLEVVHPHAAGIDIGNESHYVAVPSTRDDKPVSRFGCTTAELKAMAAWLQKMAQRRPFCFLVAAFSGQPDQWQSDNWERAITDE